MMNKKLLLEKYIKVAVRKALQEEEARQKKATRAMYLVYRFPGLKKVMEDLLSPSFAEIPPAETPAEEPAPEEETPAEA
jgi:hypothetical protein